MRTAQRMLALPMQQTIEFQRNAAALFLGGLEMQEQVQQRGVELARAGFGNYFRMLERSMPGQSRSSTAQNGPRTKQGTDGARAVRQPAGYSTDKPQRVAGGQPPRQVRKQPRSANTNERDNPRGADRG